MGFQRGVEAWRLIEARLDHVPSLVQAVKEPDLGGSELWSST